MTEGTPRWLNEGRGLAPEVAWSFTADDVLVGLDLARETGETVIADASGSVYLLDSRGRIVSLARGLHQLQEIGWSDAGTTGAVVAADSMLTILNRHLHVVSTVDLREPISAIAVDPFGHHFAVCLEGSQTRILGSSGRKVLARFETTRPLTHIRFVATERHTIAAAENGLLCRNRFDGSAVWGEPWWGNIGDLAITGDGETIFLAGLNLGIQRFDGNGNSQGTYILDGTPNRIACTFPLRRLVAATVERGLFWLDSSGEILWAAETPEAIRTLRCDPLGTGIVCGFENGRVFRLDWGGPAI